ncbi:hypothetical protein [Massilia niabensis]|uniref:Alpha/beta hydrolase n=1 Tax=Massilia niabensis TaxID=544910 RepID=A0ABW0L3K8_9BURK
MMRALYLCLLLVLLPLALWGCSYGHGNIRQDKGFFHEPHDFVLQFDDKGNIWDTAVAQRALDTIAYQSRITNTIVLTFVHGWHHNARTDDANVLDFARALARTRAVLDDAPTGNPGPYTASRLALTTSGDVKVIGIYVGWRGRSLPMPLNYLTFWGRKKAAEQVGAGDLKPFLLNLNRIYRERNKARMNRPGAPFMGLATFGHSFGGQVAFKAVAETLEHELNTAPNGAVLQGYGDLTVLVNPALEAGQYESIHQLSTRRSYHPAQSPLLLVLSSEGDWARKWMFPAARMLGKGFGQRMSGPPELWGLALGEYVPHRTHVIHVDLERPLGERPFDPSDYVERPCVLAKMDLGAERSFQNVHVKPLKNTPYNPFIVAYTNNDLVIQHSGIFEESLRNFLNDFVALTQGKRMVVSNPSVRC